MIVAGLLLTRIVRTPSARSARQACVPGVVELGRLADDDRPGAEDQDRRGFSLTRPRAVPAARDEPIEHRQGVERARRALRVVLDRLDRQRRVAQALDGAIVQVHLADVEPAAGRQRRADDLDLVVLGGHLDEPEVDVADRVVRPVMAEPQPGRLGAGRPRDDLVAQADPQQRPAVLDDRPGQRDGTVQPCRIARPRREDQRRRCRAPARPRSRSCAAGSGPAPRAAASPRTMFDFRPKSTIADRAARRPRPGRRP